MVVRASDLFLEVVVSEVEDLHSSVNPGHSQPLSAAVERHGSDSTGHIVEETNTVHLELAHFLQRGKRTQVGCLNAQGTWKDNT